MPVLYLFFPAQRRGKPLSRVSHFHLSTTRGMIGSTSDLGRTSILKRSYPLALSTFILAAISSQHSPVLSMTNDGVTFACGAEPTILDERYMRTGRSERTLALPGTLPANASKPDSPTNAPKIYVENPQATAKVFEDLIAKIENEDIPVSAYDLFDKAHLSVQMGRLDLADRFYGLMLVMLERTNYDPKLKELGLVTVPATAP